MSGASFSRETDKWGKRPAWTRAEVEAHQDLELTFLEWAADHGPIWFPGEERLADAIARVVGIKIEWAHDRREATP